VDSNGILYYFQLGGIFMYPLLLLSITGMTIVCERYWYYRRSPLRMAPLTDRLTDVIEKHASPSGITEALRMCAEEGSPGARIFEDGLRLHEAGIERIEKGMETRAAIEMSKYERGLSLLSAVANLSPLLGFLGTVAGMIDSFGSIAGSESVNAQLVSGGIFEALITTAFGLIIAIPAFAFHNVFAHRIDKLAAEAEGAAAAVVHTLILCGKRE
jgi:biopolymer transport protein ExbB